MTTQLRLSLQGNASRAAIDAAQLEGLRALVLRLRTNRYFAERLAGIDPDALNRLADLRLLPTESKVELMADLAADAPFGTRLGVDRAEIREVQTSGGTSGRGVETFALDGSDLGIAGCAYADMFRVAGFVPGMPVMLPVRVGMAAAGLLAPRACELIGALPLRAGNETTERRLDLMDEYQVGGLFTGVVYLDTLAAALRAAGRRPPASLRSIMFAGSPHSVEWADRHRDYWAAAMHEMYGSSQMGSVVASTCERGLPIGRRGVLHVHEWAAIVEVLDPDTLEPVDDGEEGELVLTPFYRRASPLLRYRTGDRVRYLPPSACSCGRQTIGIESGTISRYDDMFKIKLKNIWASEVDHVVFDELGAREYQARIYLDDQGREQVAIVVFGGQASAARVTDALHDEFGIRFEVTIEDGANAPLFDVKPKRWTDERMAST